MKIKNGAKPTLVVLAAGMGSRYGSLKQIDPFGPSGEAIIEYSIFDAVRAGFGKVVFVIRRNIEEEFKEVFGDKFGGKIAVDYAFQELDILPKGVDVPADRVKPWGTAHAVWVASEKVSGPFAVINADDFYGVKSFQLLADYLTNADAEQLNACLIGYRLKNTLSDHGFVSRGVCEISTEGNLLAVTERTHISKTPDGDVYYEENNEKQSLTGDELVSMNLMGFTPLFFEILQKGFEGFIKEKGNELKSEYFLPSALSDIVVNYSTKVPVIETPEMTYGVTYQDDKPKVKAMLQKLVDEGVYPHDLWA